jgi:hypothetical protein
MPEAYKPEQKDEPKPSEEKPRRGQQPEWATGEVGAQTPPSMTAEDERLDKEKADAEYVGKKAAGLVD